MEQLAIVDDSLSIDLLGTFTELIDFTPAASGEGAAPVRERIAVGLGARSSEPGIGAAEQAALMRLLRQAGRRAAGSGEPPVYLRAQRAPGSIAWRSEILSGTCSEADAVDGLYPAYGIGRVTLSVTRAPYWEGPEVEVPLFYNFGYGTGGVPLANRRGMPGEACNSTSLEGTALAGDLPGPLRIAFTPNAAGPAVSRIVIGLSSSALYGQMHMLEAESRAGGSAEPAADDPAYSAGRYDTLTWSGTGESLLAEWPVAAATAAAAQGRWFRPLARLALPAPPGTSLSVRVVHAGGPAWRSAWAAAGAEQMVELAAVRLPPGPPLPDLAGLALELWGRCDSSGAHSLLLDYLSLHGAESWRSYTAPSGGLPPGASLIDDGAAGAAYHDAGGLQYGGWQVQGAPLAARPGQTSRFTFTWQDTAGSASAALAASLRCWHRPRATVLI